MKTLQEIKCFLHEHQELVFQQVRVTEMRVFDSYAQRFRNRFG